LDRLIQQAIAQVLTPDLRPESRHAARASWTYPGTVACATAGGDFDAGQHGVQQPGKALVMPGGEGDDVGRILAVAGDLHAVVEGEPAESVGGVGGHCPGQVADWPVEVEE